MTSRSLRTLYVGNLPGDVREKEVEDIFYKFEEARDAEDAIEGRDGYEFDGYRLRVELARGGRGSAHSSPSDRHSSRNAGRGSRGGVSKRSEYRVMVTGLPSSASWQDLKDHMRAAGDVCFSQVFREGKGTAGIVDYTNYEDMKYAIKKLDDSEFRNAFSRGYIRVKENDSRRDRARSRSRSLSRRSRSRSHSKSPRAKSSREKSPKGKSSRRSISRSVSRSRSRSPLRPLSRSPSRSKSPASSRKKVEDKSPKKRSPSWSPKQEKSKSP